MRLLDEAAVAVQVAGSCNAILRRPDGSLYGDLFDDIGFVRAAKRKRFEFVSDRRCPPLPRNEIRHSGVRLVTMNEMADDFVRRSPRRR